MMETNHMGEFIRTVDYAATQSYQWMFIAMFVIFLIGAWLGWRWMAAHIERTANRLTEVTDRHIAQGERLAELVANNTIVMQESVNVSREVKSVVEYCRIVNSGHKNKQ
jgi:hypothetical protein